jgi:N-acyl amino acid synthase of PEP-CTERM/exosortase system
MLHLREQQLALKPNRQLPTFQLFSDYYHSFSTILADTPALREECFRIRYDVYCVERKFENPQIRPDQLERDAHDDHSAHALLVDRASDVPIGTIRLILKKPGSLTETLPFDTLCSGRPACDTRLLPSVRRGEVSRFAISKSRSQDAFEGYGSTTMSKPMPTTYIGLGLLRMAVEMAIANGVDYLCAVMEPALLRMFARCGIHFTNVGPLVAYHGLRQPCYVDVPTLVDRIKAERPDVWQVITDCGRIEPPRPKIDIACSNAGSECSAAA